MQEKFYSIGNLEQCQKCSICSTVCPMMKVNPAYPGPKQSGPDEERYRMKSSEFYDEALKFCLNCKRCEVACPSGVKVADLIQAAKLKYAKHDHVLRNAMLAGTDLMGPVASAVAPIANFALSLKPAAAVLDATLAIDHRRQFPKYSGTRFVSWFNREAAPHQEGFGEYVSYFHGCYVNYNYPRQGQDFVRVMNALGVGVRLLEKEKCCGVALMANGDGKGARRKAEVNIASIRKSAAGGLKTVVTSTSCAFMMRDEYHEVLGMDSADIRESIDTATKFIYERIESGKAKLVFKKDWQKRVAYHAPCHLKRLGWEFYTVELLKMIPGLKFESLIDNCCGIAGTFGFKKENYEYSQKIGQPLFDDIRSKAPQVVVTDCETCKWQIEMSTGAEVLHPVCVLAEALDLEEMTRINRK